MFETLRFEVDGAVATITLARPEAANAQSSQLIEELDAAFDAADADDAVRVVVLAADGKHFSAGHDLKELFEEEIKKSWEEYAEQVGRELAESTAYFREALNEILAGGRPIF